MGKKLGGKPGVTMARYPQSSSREERQGEVDHLVGSGMLKKLAIFAAIANGGRQYRDYSSALSNQHLEENARAAS